MKRMAAFLWRLDRYKTEWREGQCAASRLRYCVHEWLWYIKEGWGFRYSTKHWAKAFYRNSSY